MQLMRSTTGKSVNRCSSLLAFMNVIKFPTEQSATLSKLPSELRFEINQEAEET